MPFKVAIHNVDYHKMSKICKKYLLRSTVVSVKNSHSASPALSLGHFAPLQTSPGTTVQQRVALRRGFRFFNIMDLISKAVEHVFYVGVGAWQAVVVVVGEEGGGGGLHYMNPLK